MAEERGERIVDKHKNGRTITIKLNGTEKLSEPQVNDHEDGTLIEKSDFNNSTLENTYIETAVSEERAEESFEWILPEITDNELLEYKIVKPETKKNHQKPHYPNGKKTKGAYKPLFSL